MRPILFHGLSLALFFLALIPLQQSEGQSIRHPLDTVGFATKSSQMDSVMQRILRIQKKELAGADHSAISSGEGWKAAICPHDDYTYVGYLYPSVLKNIKAPVVILFGVAHKAKKYSIYDSIVFDSYSKWKEPYGPVSVSSLREEIFRRLPPGMALISDTLQQAEHSIEAIVPFLQYYNRNIQIVSILVPYMSFDRMQEISGYLSDAIAGIMKEKGLKLGRDIALVISTDAVHYGDEDWGGQNYAPYGTDEKGYLDAISHENEIIHTSLAGKLEVSKALSFFHYTVREDDYKTYKWTWCGRYSVPFGLLTAMKVAGRLTGNPLTGYSIGYSNSLHLPHIPVNDLGMGITAPANLHHWVGYAAIGYK